MGGKPSKLEAIAAGMDSGEPIGEIRQCLEPACAGLKPFDWFEFGSRERACFSDSYGQGRLVGPGVLATPSRRVDAVSPRAVGAPAPEAPTPNPNPKAIMRILLIGGTVFVGRHLAAELIKQGHELTLFNRGKTRPGLFPGVREVFGDRDGGLEVFESEEFDWVVDTCGYVPRVVRASAQFFKDRAKHYLFVSTVSVYPTTKQAGIDEGGAMAVIEDPETEVVDGRTYGALKAMCEQQVLEAFGERALIPRPGILTGPEDPTDRFTRWVCRIAEGDEFLAPESQAQPVELIDARDLATWMALQIGNGNCGIFNTAGSMGTMTMGSLLETCADMISGAGRPRWVSADALKDAGLTGSAELPFWLPDPDTWGLFQVTSAKAVDCGLQYRSLAETVADTLAWAQQRPADHKWPVGLTAEREAEVLQGIESPA
ncbi:MAG: 2'-hydroxyisoflavone reductase [Glaciecola sp.]|jgi:2'-hydroxyisoflavone reductase